MNGRGRGARRRVARRIRYCPLLRACGAGLQRLGDVYPAPWDDISLSDSADGFVRIDPWCETATSVFAAGDITGAIALRRWPWATASTLASPR